MPLIRKPSSPVDSPALMHQHGRQEITPLDGRKIDLGIKYHIMFPADSNPERRQIAELGAQYRMTSKVGKEIRRASPDQPLAV